MHVIRRSSFTPTPWKNGGGITHEAIRVPADGNDFRWRVSVAEIDASGPFSEFAGHNRKMVLLQGAGVRLRLGGHLRTLREVGDIVEFDGALATECELLSGPCVDLNLMVSKSMKDVRAWVECLQKPRSLQPPPHRTLLVFVISGIMSLDIENRGSTSLEAWDLAVVAPEDRGAVGPPAALDESAAPLVFFATVDDNPP